MTKKQEVNTGGGQHKHTHEGHAQELILPIISHLLKVMKSAKIMPQAGSHANSNHMEDIWDYLRTLFRDVFLIFFAIERGKILEIFSLAQD